MTPLELHLRRLCAALDDAALETLASRGLLRRAQKDLERLSPVTAPGDDASILRVQLGEITVRLPSTGPANARCSCPASGVCQHVLAAVLFLRRPLPAVSPGHAGSDPPLPEDAPTPAPENLEAELLRLTPESLEAWSGRPAFRRALELAAQAEVDLHTTGHVRFPTHNLECRFLPGAGLEGAIVSATRHDPRPVVVAAVIAVQRAAGCAWEHAPGIPSLAAATGAPRSRGEVLQASQALLRELLGTGLARLTASHAERWTTLAMAALGSQLPRLARALRGLADEVSLAVSRSAAADPARLLAALAHTHALVAALEAGGDDPRADLVGWHRTRYEPVGTLQLQGIAAWPWRTASGYLGLTVLLWEPAHRRWNTWSEARPGRHWMGSGPLARFTQPGPWEGAVSPQQLARSTFQLLQARRNPYFRLSASARSRVLVTGPSLPSVDHLPDPGPWDELGARIARESSAGLQEADPLRTIVVLRPASWGPREYDPVQQTLRWTLADANQQPADLWVPYSEVNEPVLRALEALPPNGPGEAAVVGRAALRDGRVIVEPYGLLRPGLPPEPLAWSGATPAHSTSAPSTPAPAPGSPADSAGAPLPSDQALSTEEEAPGPDSAIEPRHDACLVEIDEWLLTVAERGWLRGSGPGWERLDRMLESAAARGWTTLSNQLRRLLDGPTDSLELLRAAWLVHLHRTIPVSHSEASSGNPSRLVHATPASRPAPAA